MVSVTATKTDEDSYQVAKLGLENNKFVSTAHKLNFLKEQTSLLYYREKLLIISVQQRKRYLP